MHKLAMSSFTQIHESTTSDFLSRPAYSISDLYRAQDDPAPYHDVGTAGQLGSGQAMYEHLCTCRHFGADRDLRSPCTPIELGRYGLYPEFHPARAQLH